MGDQESDEDEEAKDDKTKSAKKDDERFDGFRIMEPRYER